MHVSKLCRVKIKMDKKRKKICTRRACLSHFLGYLALQVCVRTVRTFPFEKEQKILTCLPTSSIIYVRQSRKCNEFRFADFDLVEYISIFSRIWIVYVLRIKYRAVRALRFGLGFLFPDEFGHDSIDCIAMSVPRPSSFIAHNLLLNIRTGRMAAINWTEFY